MQKTKKTLISSKTYNLTKPQISQIIKILRKYKSTTPINEIAQSDQQQIIQLIKKEPV